MYRTAFYSLLFLLMALPVYAAKNDQALMLISHLYITQGQLPVNDIVIEYEQMSSDGSATGMALSSKDKVYFKQPYKIRLDSILVDPGNVNDGKNLIIIRDGLNAWLYLSTGQYPVKKKLDEPSPPLCLPFGLTHYPQDRDKTYTIAGKESIDGVSATRVDIDSPSGEKTSVWIDTTRWVPLKQLITQKEKNKEVRKMVLYKEIGKTRDGRYFPMRLEKYIDNNLTSLILYKALQVNTGLEENLFAPLEKLLK